MHPALVEEFVTAFNIEIKRLHKERNSGQQNRHKELATVTRKLDGLYEAIADGFRTDGLKAKLDQLEHQKDDLERQSADIATPPPILHPDLAALYKSKVHDLHTSLNKPESQTEAGEVLRSLVESITVRFHPEGPEIELVGEITNMIEAAQTTGLKGKAASEEAASLRNYRSSVKVVAGVGFEPTTFRL